MEWLAGATLFIHLRLRYYYYHYTPDQATVSRVVIYRDMLSGPLQELWRVQHSSQTSWLLQGAIPRNHFRLTHFMTASFPLLSLQINVAHFNFYLKMWPFKYVDFNFIVINLDFTAATIFQYLIWNGTWSFYAIKCVCSKNWLIKHESK